MKSRVSRYVLFAIFVLWIPTLSLAQNNTARPLITQSVDSSRLVVLKGNTYPLARAQFDRGGAPDDLPMERMLLVLKRSPDQSAALSELLDDQQDRNSPNYHKWLDPDAFGRQFGPADEDIQTITSWLRSYGFQVDRVSRGRDVIEFSGNAGQVRQAFHTSIHNYSVNGESHWANASDPQIPTALAPAVAGIFTLHNFYKKPQLHISEQKVRARLTPGVSGARPNVTFPSTPPFHALGPADFATIYNINPLASATPFPIDGTGTSIAVVARSNLFSNRQDVINFKNLFYPSTGGGFVQVFLNGPDPGDLGGGEEAEATLDATWSGAVAPGAIIRLVVSASTNTTDGIDLSELYIIDNDFAPIATESFGNCEAQDSAEAAGLEAMAQQAAAEGITYIVSTGDNGAMGCDNPNVETVATSSAASVNILASNAYTVAVGGTMFNENGQDSKYWNASNNQFNLESALSYIPEDVWNESCLESQCGQNAGIWAGSGGASALYSKPSWQSLALPGMPSDGARDVPDVSLTAASHDAYLLCLEGSCIPDSQGFISFVAVSGTSAAAPSFAGIMALVDEKMGSLLAGVPQGQADYVLYSLAKQENFAQCDASNTTALPSSGCIFNDVTTGNNAVPGEPGYGTAGALYQSGAGYDRATGLGSINVANLVNNWGSVTFNATTTTQNVNVTGSIAHGSPVNIGGTVSSNSGVPTGAVSVIALTGPGFEIPVNLGFFLLNGGAFSATTNSLPGGLIEIQTSYGGDGTYAPSKSGFSLPITVNPEASKTTLSVLDGDGNPFTSGHYGDFVYLRADVAGTSGFGVPGGSVQFSENGNLLQGGWELNSAGNASTPQGVFTLPAGANAIVAKYLGDASFNSSASSATSVTIAKATTNMTLELEGSDNNGTLIEAIINTTSGGNSPTGTVTFFSGSTALAAPATVSPFRDGSSNFVQASAFIDSPISGNQTLTATYSGDGNYSGSSAPALAVSPDFVITSNAGAGVVFDTLGLPSGTTLNVSGVDSFAGTVSFACSGLPPESTCSFSPSSLMISPTAPDPSPQTMATIITTAPHAAMLSPNKFRHNLWWISAEASMFAGIFLAGSTQKRRATKMWVFWVLLVALFIPMAGCGGGSTTTPGSGGGGSGRTDPGTPKGTYTIIVTATSGSLAHAASFRLIVQ